MSIQRRIAATALATTAILGSAFSGDDIHWPPSAVANPGDIHWSPATVAVANPGDIHWSPSTTTA